MGNLLGDTIGSNYAPQTERRRPRFKIVREQLEFLVEKTSKLSKLPNSMFGSSTLVVSIKHRLETRDNTQAADYRPFKLI